MKTTRESHLRADDQNLFSAYLSPSAHCDKVLGSRVLLQKNMFCKSEAAALEACLTLHLHLALF
eukprot:5050602-Amphidinium_carterae.1